MSIQQHIDPLQARYQTRGAVISLQELLVQRYAARILEYVAHNRSIAGISGLHLSKMRGRGIDFEEHRAYMAGDDIRTIDWRVTARTGKPFTKVFREERERPVIIAVDQSSSMFFGSQVAFKSVIAAQAAAIFCWLAIDNGDRAGGLVYSDTDHALVRPKRSRRSALHLLHQIHQFNHRLTSRDQSTPSQRSQLGETGLATALGQIRRITKPGSTLYIISDFLSINEQGMQYMAQLALHNNVVCCFIYDPLEENLPVPGYYNITDGRNKGTLNTHSGKAREAYQHNFHNRLESLQADLNRMQIPLIKLRTNQLVVEQLHQWTAQTR